MKPRFIFIHGNGTENWASSAWVPWLKHGLEELGYATHFETMPDSKLARAHFWLPYLEQKVKAQARDVIIGWSSGAVAAMRYAENHKILGSVLVSPCYTDLGDAMEKQSGYYDNPWDWESIRDNQKNIALIWGSDDPYIPQSEFNYIARQLQPVQIEVQNGKHFVDRPTFPELLAYIKNTY